MTDIKARLNRLKKIPKRLQEIKREIEYLESNPPMDFPRIIK